MSRTQRPQRKPPPNCEGGPHSVEAWGIRLGHSKVYNDVWDRFHDKLIERCQEDVEIQYKLYEALRKEGQGEGWAPAHRLNNKLFHYLQLQEEYGWTIDRAKLEHNTYMLQTWMDRIDRHIEPYLPYVIEVNETKISGEYRYVSRPFKKDGSLSANVSGWCTDSGVYCGAVGGPFTRVTFRKVDLSKNGEVKDYLINSGWEPSEWNYDETGNKRSPKLSKDDEFHGVQGSLGRLIAKRVQCRQRLGVLEGWKEIIREDGRISAQVAGIANTGRLRHKGIVNVPSPHSKAFFAKQMRQVFVAKDGWTMVGVDSKGNQIRQLAARMQDKEFTDAVLHGTQEDGTDLHSLNQKRSGAQSRSKAKNFFYGFIFGAGPGKIASTIGITVAEAKALIATYLSEMPGLKSLIDNMAQSWRTTAQKYFDPSRRQYIYRNGKIKGVDGRPIVIDSEHKILAYTLQSDEAIQMAVAYVLVHEYAQGAGLKLHEDWGMLIWMHDEYQMECKPQYKEKLAALACKAIKDAGEVLNIQCPHDGDALFGNNWYETH
jgi:DNA polymerase I-like protein with 3'-5' exonuclease and polymerase domains